MSDKKIPERMCVVCRAHKEKRDLLRVVLNKEEGMLVDLSGKKNGRGAYVCKSKDCLTLARKNKGLERSFKMSIPKEVYDTLEEEFENLEAE